ncbi:MAG: Mov34/MPN/PAD-1 family protein [Alphaproteobacteria bacterium]
MDRRDGRPGQWRHGGGAALASTGVMPGVCLPSAGRVIRYAIGTSGQTLVLTGSVLDHFDCHRQRGLLSREAGGQLFARYDGTTIQIDRATGPRPSDRRTPKVFLPDRQAERQEITRLFQDGLHFIGDWRTHAESYPIPSHTDIINFQDLFRQSRHRLHSFVMVIVGTDPFPDGLYVGLCNELELTKLFPLSLSTS